MIISPVDRGDGFYYFGSIDNEETTIWAAYYMEGQTSITIPQITDSEVYYLIGKLDPSWHALASDESLEELIEELNNRGVSVSLNL